MTNPSSHQVLAAVFRQRRHQFQMCFISQGNDYVTGTYKLVCYINNKKKNNLSLLDLEVKRNGITLKIIIKIFPLHVVPIFANGWVYWFTEQKKIHLPFQRIRRRFLSQSYVPSSSLLICFFLTHSVFV